MGRHKATPKQLVVFYHRLHLRLGKIIDKMRHRAPDHPTGFIQFYYAGTLAELREEAILLQNLCDTLIETGELSFERSVFNQSITRRKYNGE